MNSDLYKKYILSLREIGRDMSLLYVEDEEILREANGRIFKKFFGNLIMAKDGVEGLSMYNSSSVDLVITDINMPNMDGIEMSKKIKDQNPEQLLLVFSAHNESDKLMKLINLGVDGFLLKPSDNMQIVVALYKAADKINDKKILLEYQDKLERSILEISEQKRALEESVKSKTRAQNSAIVINKAYQDKRDLTKGAISLLDLEFNKISAKEFIESYPTDLTDKFENLESNEELMDISIANLSSLKTKSSITTLIKSMQNYLNVLNGIPEFSNISYAIEHLLKSMLTVESDDMSKLAELLYGVVFSLKSWRESIFVEMSTDDIHFLDKSIISDCFMIETIISGVEKSNSDVEFF